MDGFSLLLIGAGFLSAMLSGVAGLGGGSVLIAVFFSLGMPPEQAVPLFAAVQTVSNISRTVAYHRDVEWSAAGWFLLLAVPATALVAPYAELADAGVVMLALGLLILASLVPRPAARTALPPRLSFMAAGLLNGAAGMYIGATGLVVGRLFMRPEWSKQTTIGTIALTQTLGHALRVVAYGFVGFNALARPSLLVPLCAAVIFGTWAGHRLNAHVSEALFARLFRVILGLLSAKLIFDGAQELLAR